MNCFVFFVYAYVCSILLGSDDTRHLMTRNFRLVSSNIGDVGALLERNF